MERFEQVRLAGAVRPGHEHDAGGERELELGVRAKAPKRGSPDDQPASLIGMIRYRKSSVSPWMSPGRSGLMSLSLTVSSTTDSRPSRRKSALKPISSGSPAYATGSDSRASPTSCVWADTVSSPSSKRS